MSQLQAILFNKRQYNLSKAKQWLKSHNYHPLKYHITENYIRARLQIPDYNKYHYRTNNLEKNIKSIIIIPNNNMPRRRARRPARYRQPRRHYRGRGGAIDPTLIDKGLNILANLIIPAALYGGVSYGIYRAVKK